MSRDRSFPDLPPVRGGTHAWYEGSLISAPNVDDVRNALRGVNEWDCDPWLFEFDEEDLEVDEPRRRGRKRQIEVTIEDLPVEVQEQARELQETIVQLRRELRRK
jgi:hypothetical protein